MPAGQCEAHQYFGVDALCKRKPLENLREQLEHLRRVLGLDFALEAVHLIHVVRLMVTWEEKGGQSQFCTCESTHIFYINQTLRHSSQGCVNKPAHPVSRYKLMASTLL